MVFAVRESGDEQVLEGLPELVIEGLAADDARLLLDATIPGPLDERVKARILDEARGNPLALHRAAARADAGGARGRVRAPRTRAVDEPHRAQLPPARRDAPARHAAAAPDGGGRAARRREPAVARRRACSGSAPRPARPAEAAGLIELGARVRFPHPLVRSAVYRASDPSDRRDVHRALADSTDPVLDPDRRAWHRAHATATPDEAVAAEMARSADRAQGRGGLAAAAAFLQRAAELTPDPAMRVERSLAAAQAKLDVADAASASDLAGRRRARAARRAPARAAGAVARADRVRQPARARRAAAAARGGQAARSAGRRAGPRDLPRGDRVGDVRRAPRHRPG